MWSATALVARARAGKASRARFVGRRWLGPHGGGAVSVNAGPTRKLCHRDSTHCFDYLNLAPKANDRYRHHISEVEGRGSRWCIGLELNRARWAVSSLSVATGDYTIKTPVASSRFNDKSITDWSAADRPIVPGLPGFVKTRKRGRVGAGWRRRGGGDMPRIECRWFEAPIRNQCVTSTVTTEA